MNKKRMIENLVTSELWKLFQKNYPMSKYHKHPHSDAQIALLEDISKWVYDTFGDKILKDDLKKLCRDINAEED